jgi:glycosyltransferase involved in cell wall biosynthesis
VPRVSVVIPAYNSAAHIGETLASVLGQTHLDREIIVVDDGSTDATPDVVASFGPAVKYLAQRNAGVGAARNRGYRLSTGDYLAFLDADDVWVPDFLERSLDVLARHPASGFVACDGVQFAGDDVVWPHTLSGEPGRALASGSADESTGEFYREFIRKNFIATPGQVLLPRAVLDRCGPFDEDPRCSEDWDLWLRIARCYPITLCRASLIRYRVNPAGISGPNSMRELRWSLRRLPTIERHLRECDAEARPLFLARRDEVVGTAAYEAYLLGARGDRRVAIDYLRRLQRLAPGYREPLAYLIALHLPNSLVSAASRTLRALGLRAHDAAR